MLGVRREVPGETTESASEHHVGMAPGAGPVRPPRLRHAGLPVALNALVGRDREVAAVAAFLSGPDTRLVTVTGPPGVGKTRLAIAVATALEPRLPDGVVFVDLTAVRDAALVAEELAAALGVGDGPDRPGAVLATARLLLVVDNFEHVLDAAPAVGALLTPWPRLRVLVTSRERLHLRGEREVPVEPLAVPGGDEAGFAATPSVALLLQAVRAFHPDFAVTAANRAALAEICVRLDGLPLALELAAVRLKLFTPAELTFRLRHRMTVLTGGARDVPDRHRTLRAALAWSHNLLAADERALFRRLSVFVGSFTLEAAQHLAAVEPGTADRAVDLMASLVDKSLVQRWVRAGETAGYTLLESLREYAAEQLAQHGEVEATRGRHARYYAGVAASVEAAIGTAAETALDGVGPDEGNLRAALAHATSSGDVGAALPLAATLGWYCYVRGRLGDGRTVLDRVLTDADRPTTAGNGRADDVGLAAAVLAAGVLAVALGDEDRAERHLARSVYLDDRSGGTRRTAIASAFLGHLARARGRPDDAVAHYERAAALHGELGDAAGVAWSRYDLGLLARSRGELDGAARHLRASLARFRAMQHPWAMGCAAWALGTVELHRDRPRDAAALLVDAVERFAAVGDGRGVAQCLEAAAALVATRRGYDSAARLLGAAAALRERLAVPVLDEDRAEHEALARRVCRGLDPADEERARHAGHDLSQAAVVELMRTVLAEPVPADPLTPREREVAALVARGCTNRQIGRALGIAEKTAEVHVHHIIHKLGARSRAEVAAWVGARGR
jgi:non-specific serine/threonine protein kinase